MDTATFTPTVSQPAPPPTRSEVSSLLAQVLACSAEEKRYLLEQLLRNCLGPTPPKEMKIYNVDGSEYVFILEPEYRIRLFLTPERLAEWEKEDLSKCRSFSEIVELLNRGDEEEIRQWRANRNN